jgi:indolepyruvate ferredoxin oxidoreductase alpha subunit
MQWHITESVRIETGACLGKKKQRGSVGKRPHPIESGVGTAGWQEQIMAERSFAREVQDLKLGEGDTFRGEGILAVTKALLQSGVSYVGGYQGSPISHLMDVLDDAKDVLDDLGVHFESSASEAAAAAMLSASVLYPIRGAVTWKSTAGTNVASDALANLASGGVIGGAVIIIGEDYGEGSSIMQERTHAFAMKSQMWLLDPRPNLTSIVDTVESAFELSEASNTPVMLEMRIRTCHVHGQFIAKDNRKPAHTLRHALENPRRDLSRIVLPPSVHLHENEKLEKRWPAAIAYIRDHKLNEFFGPDEGDVGIILQGGLYNTVLRALQYLGLADIYGESRIPLYCMNVTYPLLDDEITEFCVGKSAVLVIEEGQPEYIEQALNTILRRRDIPTKIGGKGMLPMGGEYTAEVMTKGIETFIETYAHALLGNHAPVPSAAAVLADPLVAALREEVPARPAGFCTGCPERPIFAAMKLVEQELGLHHISADIGCHLFSILPPFNIGATTMGYGLGPASASAFNVKADKRPISIMGDGGFWHNGLATSVGNAVFNKQDGVILVVDNFYSAATGGQDILSSRARNTGRKTNNSIVNAVKGIGVNWVRQIDRTYDVAKMRDTLREALTTPEAGPKVIVASSECMLNKQRREKPLFTKAVKSGRRMVKQRFGVDEDICTGDHACIRLSGCPSLSLKQTADPLKDDPVAAIDNSCVGCGNCGEVADAAILCPSFYRADIIHNPSRWDRMLGRMRKSVIGYLQRRRDRRTMAFA